MNRRKFLFTSSGAAAGSLVAPGLAAREDDAGLYAGSGLTTGAPKPLPYDDLPGFLSVEQITPHHTAHYGGALQAFNGVETKLETHLTGKATVDPQALQRMKQLQSSRGNSVILHELYFDGLAPKPAAPRGNIRSAIEQRFGTLEKWAEDFVSSAKSAAGWAMLVNHPVNGNLYNVVSDEHAQGPLWLAAPLVVIDVYEHAFYIDYQNNKGTYVERFLEFINWAAAERRYRPR